GRGRNVLVVASDCRLAAPRSPLERNVGDGAAALLISAEAVAAEIEQQHAISDEIIDVWRLDSDPFVHSWEDRFVVEHGYRATLVEAMKGLFGKLGRSAKDFSKAALYAPDVRSHAAAARALGFEGSQIQDPLFGRLGNTGAAFAPMLLVSALENARPGDSIAVASYGDGADALALRVTDANKGLSDRRGIRWHLERRGELGDYDKFLRFRHLEASEHDRRGG